MFDWALCQYPLRSCHTRWLVTAICPRDKITYMSHEVTRCRNKSQRQSSIILFPGSAVSGKAHNWFIYRLVTATCRKCMWLSHEGTACACDILTGMSHEFSNWFEFMQQVTASNSIKTTCHTRRLVAGMCRGDRSLRVTGPLVSFRIT